MGGWSEGLVALGTCVGNLMVVNLLGECFGE